MSDFSTMKWAAVVLAAGKGTRMKSDLPKVLHDVAGRPMAARVLDAVRSAGISEQILVIGGEVERFGDLLEQYPKLTVTQQNERKGTADAVAAGGFGLTEFTPPPYASGELLRGKKVAAEYLLVCTGDTPCLSAETLRAFITAGLESDSPIGVVGMIHPDPTGYGRLVLDDKGFLTKIVEEKDTNDAEKKINLCNSGIIYWRADLLNKILGEITNNNQSNEYYLTDCFEIAARLGERSYVFQTPKFEEFDGVNTPEQLKKVSSWLVANGRA